MADLTVEQVANLLALNDQLLAREGQVQEIVFLVADLVTLLQKIPIEAVPPAIRPRLEGMGRVLLDKVRLIAPVHGA